MLKLFLFTAAITLCSILFGMSHKGILLNGTDGIWLPQEDSFIDPNQSNERIQFPDASLDSSLQISLIIPAYNEADRLPGMLEDAIGFFKDPEQNGTKYTWEIIVVDDGSSDTTSDAGLLFSKRETTDKVRILTLQSNRGKGGAVRRGVLCARGKYILMADADKATKISDLLRLESRLLSIQKKGHGMAIGSRAHLESQAIATRTPLRNLLMYGFHFLVKLAGVSEIRDTQCGFKLFTRETARVVFGNLHIERWAFDIELLYIGQLLEIPMVEVAVNWTEVPGSKMDLFAASVEMAISLILMRLAYMFGIWRIIVGI